MAAAETEHSLNSSARRIMGGDDRAAGCAGWDFASVREPCCAIALLGVLIFWGGMVAAARQFPSDYDWRYMPISNLLTAARNPAGYLWAAGGVVSCGLCGLCWAAAVGWRRAQPPAGKRSWDLWALRLGNFGMACSAVPSHWLLLWVSKGHEMLTILAFAGLCLGMVQRMFRVVAQALQQRMRTSVRRQRLSAAFLAGIAVLPILLTGLIQAYVFYALPHLPWVNLGWRARGIPAYLSFAFWEWITCAVLSAYMVGLAVISATMTPSQTWVNNRAVSRR
jgi:hypothetical protein